MDQVAASALAAARIMVFHSLLPSILMPAVSPGVWSSDRRLAQ